MYTRRMYNLTWLEDDTLPFLDVYTGTEIFAEAFGCRVFRPDNDMPFALPLIQNAGEVSRLRTPDISAPSLARLFEIADELRCRAGPEALLRLADVQSSLDIAALIWDKNNFYAALIEAPEAVFELVNKVGQLLRAFFDEWYYRYGVEFIAHYPDYYMPGGITLSEDEIGCVSQAMFTKFFLPELKELAERYGGIGIHCCAAARHQWENFTQVPGLRMLNLVQPVEVLRQAYPYFADVVPQMHSWCGEGDPWTWPAAFPPPTRLVLQVEVDTRQQALQISERMQQALS